MRSVVEEHKHAEELWSRMVELDWPALAVPEDDGGLGLGFVELAVVCEQLGARAVPGTVPGHRHPVRPGRRGGGQPEQRHRFLGAVAGDGIVGTLAVAEAAGDFDAAAIDHGGDPRGGDCPRRARSTSSSTATSAAEMWWRPRLAGSAGDDGIALFVVPAERVDAEPMVGLDASRGYATVVLDSVRVRPRPCARASPGGAGPALRGVVEEATVALATEMVGTCQAIFDIVHAYVSEREQFGVKVGSFQAIKHKLANMYVSVESARATAYFAAAAIAESDDRRDAAVAMAKASVGDCQKLVTTEGIQCLGGIGYTWEHDMHLYVKRAKAGAALFGTGAQHLERCRTCSGCSSEAPGDRRSAAPSLRGRPGRPVAREGDDRDTRSVTGRSRGDDEKLVSSRPAAACAEARTPESVTQYFTVWPPPVSVQALGAQPGVGGVREGHAVARAMRSRGGCAAWNSLSSVVGLKKLVSEPSGFGSRSTSSPRTARLPPARCRGDDVGARR